jgi:hypothetical protein
MALSITIPTPPGSGTVRVAIGKAGREFASPAAAVDWAQGVVDDAGGNRDLLLALAILLASRRPALRGKTLTLDLAANANLLTVA